MTSSQIDYLDETDPLLVIFTSTDGKLLKFEDFKRTDKGEISAVVKSEINSIRITLYIFSLLEKRAGKIFVGRKTFDELNPVFPKTTLFQGSLEKSSILLGGYKTIQEQLRNIRFVIRCTVESYGPSPLSTIGEKIDLREFSLQREIPGVKMVLQYFARPAKVISFTRKPPASERPPTCGTIQFHTTLDHSDVLRTCRVVLHTGKRPLPLSMIAIEYFSTAAQAWMPANITKTKVPEDAIREADILGLLRY